MVDFQIPEGFSDAQKLEQDLESKPETYWIERGEKRALKLFHGMSERVPAYKDYLKANKFNPKSVETIEDIKSVPTIDKDNYLRKYPKEMLTWDGAFPKGQWLVSTTSGSTGKPYYFPRQSAQDEHYAIMAELYMRKNFRIQDRSTLYVVAFPMGAWIGGVFTYEAMSRVAAKGYDLSIITPGIDKQEVINAVSELGDKFDQVVIGAYAPFLKDIIDDGLSQGLDWSSYNLGLVFSAEAFSEKFRDYVIDKVGLSDPYTSSLNHYGTVDLGTMSHETPESNYIRRLLVSQNKLSSVFPEATRQPTLTQYIPELFYFEQVDDNLLCSAYSGLPLFRYDLKDYGGVISREDLLTKIGKLPQADDNNLIKNSWNLPYVYVYERNDLSVSYYAFLVYPDTVRRALQSQDFSDSLTGKFTMSVDYDDEGRQRFSIHCESKAGSKPDDKLANNVVEQIHSALLNENSEYRETATIVGDEVKPRIVLYDYEDSEYFKPGTKQKWVKK